MSDIKAMKTERKELTAKMKADNKAFMELCKDYTISSSKEGLKEINVLGKTLQSNMKAAVKLDAKLDSLNPKE